ncbi:MAG: hypothetical protein ACO4CH_07095 [Saprospiraceae bacterium]
MHQSSTLLETLIHRWVESTNHSEWRHAYPSGLTCIDLCRLDIQEEEEASRWVQKLISGQSLEVEISPDAYSGPVVRHLFAENRNGERLRGKRPLAIGYPLILQENPADEEQPFAIPVFVWDVNLEPHPAQADSWMMRRDASSRVIINPYLLNDLEPRRELLNGVWDLVEKLRNHSWKTRDLISAIEEMSRVSSLDYEFIDKGIQRFPPIEQARILGARGAVVWAGILTTFPENALAIRRRLEAELARIEAVSADDTTEDAENATFSAEETDGGHPFGLFALTRGQEYALLAAREQPLSIVVGPSGSGKTMALATILTNALSNGKRCLVISPEIHSLQRIQTRLLEAGIEGQSFLLKDDHADLPLLMELLRRAGERVKTNSPFPEEQFELQLQKTWRLYTRFHKAYRAVNQPIFGHLNWTETVGAFLKSNRAEGKELLGSQLNPSDFVFTFSEYEMLREAIEFSQPLYVPINSLKHPLSALHPDIFQSFSVSEARAYLGHHLEDFLSQATSLQYRYIAKLDSYAEKLTTHYEDYYREVRDQLRTLTENIEDFKNKYGADFEESGVVTTGKLHVYGVFSNKHKHILQAKDVIALEYARLQKLHQQHLYFDYRFSDAGTEQRNIRRIMRNLEDFQKTLDHWYRRIPQSVQEDLQRLTSKNIHRGLDFEEQLEELEYALDILIGQINDLHIFETALSNNSLTLHKRKKVLEDIIENLEQTRFQMRDFDQFHPWQANWLKLGDLSRKLVRALVKVKPENWMAAFESWYFHNQLTLGFEADTPQQESSLEAFSQALTALRAILPAQIRHIWHQQLSSTLRTFRRANKSLYQMTFGRQSGSSEAGEPISLPWLLTHATEAVLDAIPVVLATPAEAAAALPERGDAPIFDLVLIDEAVSVPAETALPLLWLGQRGIVFGNPQGTPEEGIQSILDLASQTGSKKVTLREIVYPFPPTLLHFQQKLLHSYATVAFSMVRPAWPADLSTEQAGGVYEENSGINVIEAEFIVDHLVTFPPSHNHTFPRITVACATIQQRDLIADLLIKARQKGGKPEEKIRQLERSGLFIVTFDELYGLQTDVRILSVAYGPSTQSGPLTSDFETLDQPEHARSVGLALTQNCRQLRIVHSLPEEAVQKRALRAGSMAGVLCTLIRNQKQEEQVEFEDSQVLKPADEGKSRQEALFCTEVAGALKPYLGAGRLLLDQEYDNIPIPLVIKPSQEEKDHIIILPDGFLTRDDTVSLQWEYFLRARLEARGFRFLTTWSANWWRDPRQEARKLASQIIRLDNQPAQRPVNPPAEREETDDE